MFRKFFSRFIPLPLTSNEANLKQLLLAAATPFGSRVWGGAKPSSDYDYFTSYADFRTIRALLGLHDMPYILKDTYINKLNAESHLTFTLSNGESYDLICFDSDASTNRFTTMCSITTEYSKIKDLSSRIDRITAFDQIRYVVNNHKITLDSDLNTFIRTNYPETLI